MKTVRSSYLMTSCRWYDLNSVRALTQLLYAAISWPSSRLASTTHVRSLHTLSQWPSRRRRKSRVCLWAAASFVATLKPHTARAGTVFTIFGCIRASQTKRRCSLCDTALSGVV